MFLGDFLVGVLVGVDFVGVFRGVLEGVEVAIPLDDGGGELSLVAFLPDSVVVVVSGWPVVWAKGAVSFVSAVAWLGGFSGFSAGVGLVAIWLPG